MNTILTLGILSGNVKNAFSYTIISDNSNNLSRTQYQALTQLSVVAPLDYQTRNVYTLVLFAFDTNNLVTLNITVNLLSANSNAPVFILRPGLLAYQYVVPENTITPILLGDSVCIFSCPHSLYLVSCLYLSPARF